MSNVVNDQGTGKRRQSALYTRKSFTLNNKFDMPFKGRNSGRQGLNHLDGGCPGVAQIKTNGADTSSMQLVQFIIAYR
jgi:hypothetical protein